jgi:hypothetical protein
VERAVEVFVAVTTLAAGALHTAFPRIGLKPDRCSGNAKTRVRESIVRLTPFTISYGETAV